MANPENQPGQRCFKTIGTLIWRVEGRLDDLHYRISVSNAQMARKHGSPELAEKYTEQAAEIRRRLIDSGHKDPYKRLLTRPK